MSYTLPAGARITEAYLAWLAGLRDAIGRVQVRAGRLVHGTPGDHRSLSGGLWELRVHPGPGYRRLAAALPQEQ
jgi:putative addiction module killer protein